MLNNLSCDFNRIPYLDSHTPDLFFLTFPFHLDMVGYLCANEGYCLEQEGFDQFFFGLTLSGFGMLECKGSKYILEPNQAFFLDRKEYFKIGTSKGQKWDFKWFYFGGIACKGYYDLINGKSFQAIPLVNAAEVSQMIDELHILMPSRNPVKDSEISMIITKILACVIKNKFLDLNIAADNLEILKKSQDYILSSYCSNIKIKDVCNAAFTSKSHLIKLFREHLHTTPHKYITKLRIDKSKELLSGTCIPITEIAHQTGFDTTSLFIDNFKKYAGITPNRYRNSIFKLAPGRRGHT